VGKLSFNAPKAYCIDKQKITADAVYVIRDSGMESNFVCNQAEDDIHGKP
jgi:hypothetical protein